MPGMEGSKNYEQKEHTHELVEDVVADVTAAHQSCREHPEDPTCDCKLLHDRLCHTESGDIFEKYENHDALTFDDIERSIELVLTRMQSDTEEGVLGEEDMD